MEHVWQYLPEAETTRLMFVVLIDGLLVDFVRICEECFEAL